MSSFGCSGRRCSPACGPDDEAFVTLDIAGVCPRPEEAYDDVAGSSAYGLAPA